MERDQKVAGSSGASRTIQKGKRSVGRPKKSRTLSHLKNNSQELTSLEGDMTDSDDSDLFIPVPPKIQKRSSKSRPKFTFGNIEALHQHVLKSMETGRLASSMVLCYEGQESLDVLMSRIFTFSSSEDTSFVKAYQKWMNETGIQVVNPPTCKLSCSTPPPTSSIDYSSDVPCLTANLPSLTSPDGSSQDDTERKEKLYMKLMEDLTNAGAFDQENVEDPTEVEIVTENPTEVEIVTENPTEVEIVTENPTEVEIVTENPTEVEVVTQHPSEVEIVTENPTEVEIVTENPTEVEIVTQNPSEVEIVTQNPTEVEIVSEHPTQYETNSIENPTEIEIFSQNNDAETESLIPEMVVGPAKTKVNPGFEDIDDIPQHEGEGEITEVQCLDSLDSEELDLVPVDPHVELDLTEDSTLQKYLLPTSPEPNRNSHVNNTIPRTIEEELEILNDINLLEMRILSDEESFYSAETSTTNAEPDRQLEFDESVVEEAAKEVQLISNHNDNQEGEFKQLEEKVICTAVASELKISKEPVNIKLKELDKSVEPVKSILNKNDQVDVLKNDVLQIEGDVQPAVADGNHSELVKEEQMDVEELAPNSKVNIDRLQFDAGVETTAASSAGMNSNLELELIKEKEMEKALRNKWGCRPCIISLKIIQIENERTVSSVVVSTESDVSEVNVQQDNSLQSLPHQVALNKIEEEIVVVKRRRGRPPKKKLPVVVDPIIVESTIEGTGDPIELSKKIAEDTNVKPSSSPVLNETTTIKVEEIKLEPANKNNSDSNIQQSPRRRGRPPSATKSASETKGVSAASEIMTTTAASETKAKVPNFKELKSLSFEWCTWGDGFTGEKGHPLTLGLSRRRRNPMPITDIKPKPLSPTKKKSKVPSTEVVTKPNVELVTESDALVVPKKSETEPNNELVPTISNPNLNVPKKKSVSPGPAESLLTSVITQSNTLIPESLSIPEEIMQNTTEPKLNNLFPSCVLNISQHSIQVESQLTDALNLVDHPETNILNEAALSKPTILDSTVTIPTNNAINLEKANISNFPNTNLVKRDPNIESKTEPNMDPFLKSLINPNLISSKTGSPEALSDQTITDPIVQKEAKVKQNESQSTITNPDAIVQNKVSNNKEGTKKAAIYRPGPKSRKKIPIILETSSATSSSASQIENVNNNGLSAAEVNLTEDDNRWIAIDDEIEIIKIEPGSSNTKTINKRRRKSAAGYDISSSDDDDTYVPLPRPPTDSPEVVPLDSSPERDSSCTSSLSDSDNPSRSSSTTSEAPTAIQKMKREMKKSNPDLTLLKQLLDQTRTRRKEYLAQIGYEVKQGIKKYPALRLYSLMKYEFSSMERSTKWLTDRMADLEAQLRVDMDNVTKKKRKSPGMQRHEIWETALKKLNDKSLSQDAKNVLGMICLCFFLAEGSAKKLFKLRKQGDPVDTKKITFPTLDVVETEIFKTDAKDMWIYCDRVKCISVPNIYEGILTIYAMHYVFDIVYNDRLKVLFTHFDKITKAKP